MKKTRYPRETAMQMADVFTEAIIPVCGNHVIGGSIRREKSMVGDIEILAVPNYREEEVREDLFTWNTVQHCLLEEKLRKMADAGHIEPRHKSDGSLISWLRDDAQKRYIAMWFHAAGARIPLDLFIIRQDRLDWWGWHLLLRTGPGDANQALVTPGHKYGLKPSDILIQKGIVYKHGKPYPLRTEQAVFDTWDMHYVPPRQRSIEAYQNARKPLDPELR